MNAFLDNKPMAPALSQKLGITPVVGFDASRHRYVFSDKHLHDLPTIPPAFLTSNLISIPGRLRVMLET